MQLRGAGKTIPAWDIIYTGHHGYNPYATEEMRAIMFAYGPKLKQSYVGAPIMMTDHYNLLCYLLGLKPNANNGSWKRVADLVAEKSASQTQNSFSASPGRLSIAALVFTTICLTLIRWRLVCSIL